MADVFRHQRSVICFHKNTWALFALIAILIGCGEPLRFGEFKEKPTYDVAFNVSFSDVITNTAPIGDTRFFSFTATDQLWGEQILVVDDGGTRAFFVGIDGDIEGGDHNPKSGLVWIWFNPFYDASEDVCEPSLYYLGNCYYAKEGTVTVDKSQGIKLTLKNVVMEQRDDFESELNSFVANGVMKWVRQ